ncbi:hypothetical protein K466DRAFT_605414 [Polyporus arcularius HHB13444]|uniref:Uncharacterized protein n=1 Tax=Polyporus arcularius HHB13444 TaxID=1314778 RepID=A0A5C3NSQ0_9APHY|nr:hypothetical protein K466DRAFT_605414 [Polyporus arcularius HHB13444]
MSSPYISLVEDLDNAARDRLERGKKQASIAAESQVVVEINWWPKDDADTEPFDVRVPYYPHFHPKDCPDLVKRFKLEENDFQWWDWKRFLWVNGSFTSPYRNIASPGGELHYRTFGVQSAPGMPNRGLKRLRSPSDADRISVPPPPTIGATRLPVTPRRTPSRSNITPGSSHYYTTPSSSHGEASVSGTPSTLRFDMSSLDAFNTPSSSRLIHSPASFNTTPEHIPSPSSSRAVTPRSRCSTPGSMFSELHADDIGSRLGEGDHPAARAPPMAPLFPGAASFASSLSGTSGSPGDLDLDPAPRGPYGWPFKYVSDMAVGFAAMETFERDMHMPKQLAFETAFKMPYKRATVSDNARAWEAAGLIHGEREEWVRRGRQPDGEWRLFYRKWKQVR